jgi:ribose transport system substrate-binding protein
MTKPTLLRLRAPAAIGLAALAVAGCAAVFAAETSAAPTATAAKKKLSVAFIPGATGVGFYIAMGDGIQAEAKKLGMSYSTQGSPNFDPADQTPVVEAVCSRKPSLLLIAPTDPVAMRPAIQTCMSEGVKVATVDTGLTDTQGLVSAITSNNIQGGQAAGELIGKALGGKGSVALLSLSATATTQVERIKGAQEELASKYPGITVLPVQYTQQAESSSETTAESILSANPTVGAFFGSAEPNAEGAAAAATATNKKLVIVGYDADPPSVQLLQSGALAGLVIQQPALEGKTGVEYGYDALTGHKSLIKKNVVLSNILVTTAESNNPKYKKYYYPG